VGGGKVIKNTITQASHGFTAGMAIRYNNASATGITGDKYMAAIATTPEESEVVGVIDEIVGPNEFSLTYAGEINPTVFQSPFTIGDNDVFFLSGATAGLLTSTPPTSAGQVIKPVLIKTEDDKAVVTNFIGTVIGGSSTVSLDTVQPVGTIQPYAGATGDVPDTWALCDGRAVSVSAYPELNARLGRSFGLHLKVTLSQNWGESVFGDAEGAIVNRDVPQVGQYFHQQNIQRYSGVIIEVGDDYFIADMDYLSPEPVDGGFVPRGTYDDEIDFSNVGSSLFLGTDFSEADRQAFGSGTPVTNDASGKAHIFSDKTSDQVSPISYTTEIVSVRLPDLRGKVVLGESASGQGTVIPPDRDFNRGQIGGSYELVPIPASGQAAQFDGRGGGQGENDALADLLQPYVGMSWIMKITPRSQAAFLDNLTAQIPLVDLTDVDATGMTAGEILVYDSNVNAADKFRPVLLYNGGFPETADDKSAFQIQVDGTNKPRISVGSSVESNDGFQVRLDGIYQNNFRVYETSSSSTPTLEVKEDAIGVGTPAQPYNTNQAGGANLTLGPGGMKFTASSESGAGSNRMSHFRNSGDTVRSIDTASDNHLVSEKAIREAIETGSNLTYRITDFGQGNINSYRKEIFPSWVSTIVSGTGEDKVTYNGTGVSYRHRSRDNTNLLFVSNGSGADIIVTVHFGGWHTRDNPYVGYEANGADYEILVKNGAGIDGTDIPEVQFTGYAPDHPSIAFGTHTHRSDMSFRKATAAESSAGYGHGRPEYHGIGI